MNVFAAGFVVLMLGTAATAVAAAAADQVTVQREGQSLRKAKLATSAKVADLNKGQTIDVLKREKGWLFADAGDGRQGWAHDSWLKPSGGMAKALRETEVAVSGSSEAQRANDAAAGKGAGALARQIAVRKNYSPATVAQLDRLMALRATIADSGEWEAFAKAGKVGPADAR